MGDVKDRYLKYELEGDKYVGPYATGKYQLSKSFALSQAYLNFPILITCRSI